MNQEVREILKKCLHRLPEKRPTAKGILENKGIKDYLDEEDITDITENKKFQKFCDSRKKIEKVNNF